MSSYFKVYDKHFFFLHHSMPISLEEIADSMDVKEFQKVAPPLELVAIPAFQFLKSWSSGLFHVLAYSADLRQEIYVFFHINVVNST